MGRLAIERRVLMWVLAIAEVVDLLENHGEARREGRPGDLVEVRRNLRVVRGHGTKRLGRELRPELRRDRPELAQLLDDPRIVGGLGHGRHPGSVPCRRAEQRCATNIDQLDGLIDPDNPAPDLGCERGHVHDHDVDGADALLLELGELARNVAPGEDPGVDGRVERLDLAADEGRNLGQLRHGGDLDAIGREVLARPVGREDVDAQLAQLAGEDRDPVAVGDRQQGSQRRSPPVFGRGPDRWCRWGLHGTRPALAMPPSHPGSGGRV
jgi:hypothetical protein